jgi:ketosteroid isomerase-like protein
MKTNRIISASSFIMMLMITLLACNNRKQVENNTVLSETDRFYSAMSAKKGMNASFMAMFDSAGVMLRANQMPVEGIAAIRAALMSESDSTFNLTWEPKFAKMAASGDIGYTYGTYKITDRYTDSIIGVGKYATIWQKQKDGKWKAILDTGNPGLGK